MKSHASHNRGAPCRVEAESAVRRVRARGRQGQWFNPCRPGALTRRPECEILRGPQLALHSTAHWASPSPPSEGGEGWGEEGRLAYKQGSSRHGGTPLPSPLPARSSRREGVGAV